MRFLIGFFAIVTVTAQATTSVWYVRSQATGDGTSAAVPMGSTAALEAATKPGDVIILMPGKEPFDGGIALKKGQTLIGLADGNRKPSITNSHAEQNGGNGVLLADDCKVLNVRIEQVTGERRARSRRYGGLSPRRGSGRRQSILRIHHGQDKYSRADFAWRNSFYREPVWPCDRESSRAMQRDKHPRNWDWHIRAWGAHRAVWSWQTPRPSEARLVQPLFDMGLIALADGRNSEAHLEIDNTIVQRAVKQSRSKCPRLRERPSEGHRTDRAIEVGRDGPGRCSRRGGDESGDRRGSNSRFHHRKSGTDEYRRLDPQLTGIGSRTSAREHRLDRYQAEYHPRRRRRRRIPCRSENIWLGPTVFDKAPFARGRYRLSVRDSTIEKGSKQELASAMKAPSSESRRSRRVSRNAAQQYDPGKWIDRHFDFCDESYTSTRGKTGGAIQGVLPRSASVCWSNQCDLNWTRHSRYQVPSCRYAATANDG